jgi:hypothetical protein
MMEHVTEGAAAAVRQEPRRAAEPLTERGSAALARLAGWLRAEVFREPAGSPVTWRKVLAAIAFTAGCAALSLARTGGPGALNSIWIEDAGNFLNDALHKSVLTTLTTQMNGYYDVVPRAITAIAVAAGGVTFAPAIMSAAAALQYAGYALLAFVASGPHLRSVPLRLLVSVPAVVIPLGYTQVNNDLATVQFIALYGVFWLLIWRPAGSAALAAKITAAVVMLGITLTSILPLLFAPLVAARLIADRSKAAISLAACWALGIIVQWSVHLRGLSNRPGNWYTSPLWAARNYVTRAVPRAIFGERALGGPGTNAEGRPVPLHITSQAAHDMLIAGAWLVVIAVIAVALARLTDPHWPLAVTAGAFSVLVFLGEIVNNLPIVQPRYVIAPALLLYLAIAAMLRPRQTAGVTGWLPAGVFAAVLLAAVAVNYRVTSNGRAQSPAWTSVVAHAHSECVAQPSLTTVLYQHAWWQVFIPCDRLR